MDRPKFLQQVLGVLLAVVFLAGFTVPAATAAQPAGLFTLLKSVQVTPSGNYLNGDFLRIAYVPGKDRFVVTFGTKLTETEGGCTAPEGTIPAYAYKEYTADMVETGNAGVISCHAKSDTGGLFVGNDFYLASAERNDNVEGWNVAKLNAVTWASSVDYFYPLTDSQASPMDPMVAYVNGQVDISSVYGGNTTHHNFFTTDLQFLSMRVLSDTPHYGFSSMITQGGVINFLSSQGGFGDLIVMQYDPSWTYLGVKTLKEDGATPMGVAFDGNRFYVAYTDASERTTGCMCENVHLAAFDTSWNLVDYIAVTSLTLQDQMSAIHPSLAMKDNRLYVAYTQNAPAGGVETLQGYVKVYDLPIDPTLSFTIETSANEYQLGEILTLNVTVTNSTGATVTLDPYLVLQRPDGAFFAYVYPSSFLPVDPTNLSATLLPIARNIALPSGTALVSVPLFSLALGPQIPVLTGGAHVFYAAFTVPGTYSLLTPIARAEFELVE